MSSKLQYRLLGQKTVKTRDGQEMVISSITMVTKNRTCKTCRIRQRANHSSRCSICKILPKPSSK